jgi:hypothetical protein
MKQEITINDFSKHLFWDVDKESFDLEKYPELVYSLIEIVYSFVKVLYFV